MSYICTGGTYVYTYIITSALPPRPGCAFGRRGGTPRSVLSERSSCSGTRPGEEQHYIYTAPLYIYRVCVCLLTRGGRIRLRARLQHAQTRSQQTRARGHYFRSLGCGPLARASRRFSGARACRGGWCRGPRRTRRRCHSKPRRSVHSGRRKRRRCSRCCIPRSGADSGSSVEQGR